MTSTSWSMTSASAAATVRSRRFPALGPRPQFGVQLGERFEREPPLGQARMGHHEVRIVIDAPTLDGEEVQVHQAWPIPMTERVAAESPLDRLQLDQQRTRLQLGDHRHRSIEEIRLI